MALQLACRSLRAGRRTWPLAGGATVMPTPGMLVDFSRLGAASPPTAAARRSPPTPTARDGRGRQACSLLERLSDARRLGHPVVGLIRAVAVNQDGASNGLSAPNGRAQAG
ncbi:beta-ketoacyl synthase N-terminal-like domain-containing protein [Streptomyces sp. KL116D]|uniref:beta-ketoacyl synthase N-terminal-like domain-containing protein n=1 Tax=Streptomyces sp. KL116D TaxID=3045152 RepID=UPI0035567A44